MGFLKLGPLWHAMELDAIHQLDQGKTRKEAFAALSPKYNPDQQSVLAKVVSNVISSSDQEKYLTFRNVLVGLILIYMTFYTYQFIYFVSTLYYTRVVASILLLPYVLLELYILNGIKQSIIEFRVGFVSLLPALIFYQFYRIAKSIAEDEHNEIFFVILGLQFLLLVSSLVFRWKVFSHVSLFHSPSKNDAGEYVFKD